MLAENLEKQVAMALPHSANLNMIAADIALAFRFKNSDQNILNAAHNSLNCIVYNERLKRIRN